MDARRRQFDVRDVPAPAREFGIDLEITPLVTYHSFHALASGDNWEIGVDASERSATIRAFDGAVPFRVYSDRATFAPSGAWWWGFRHRAESKRGLSDHGDLFAPGTFQARLQPGESVALLYTTEADAALDAKGSLRATHERQRQLVATAGVTEADPIVQQLVLAADQFLVARPQKDNPAGRSVIAGYHWFNDWGRDTMISLPGLALRPAGLRRRPRSCGHSLDILRTVCCRITSLTMPASSLGTTRPMRRSGTCWQFAPTSRRPAMKRSRRISYPRSCKSSTATSREPGTVSESIPVMLCFAPENLAFN